jgi:hypothetical protein
MPGFNSYFPFARRSRVDRPRESQVRSKIICHSAYGNVATSLPVKPSCRDVEIILIVLQLFQVLFLWLHDWIPLGRLSDVAAVRSQDTSLHLVVVTLIQTVPFTIGLLFSLLHFGRPYARWLYMWFWISYGLLFCRTISRLVDTLSLSLGTRMRRSLSDHVGNTHHSYQLVMDLSRTLRASCFIWQVPPPCSSFLSFLRAETA